MGQAKKEADSNTADSRTAETKCWRCREEILGISEIEAAYQGNGIYLCENCRHILEKMEQE